MRQQERQKRTPTLEDCADMHPGKALEQCIEYADISIEEFADKLDISPDELSNIISGDSNLTKDLLRKIAKATKLPLDNWREIQQNYEKALAEAKQAE